MKAFIAYSLVIVGIPTVVGLLFGKILIWPLSRIVGVLRNLGLLGGSDEATAAQDLEAALAWSIRGSIKVSMPDRIVHICMDVFNGLGAVLTAGFIFNLFGLPPSPFYYSHSCGMADFIYNRLPPIIPSLIWRPCWNNYRLVCSSVAVLVVILDAFRKAQFCCLHDPELGHLFVPREP